jgi:hypothetical protein
MGTTLGSRDKQYEDRSYGQADRPKKKVVSDAAVILVPAGGADATSFQAVAVKMNAEVYKNKATVVTAAADDSGAVTFKRLDGKDFSLASAPPLASFVTVSHAGSIDGPVLGGGAQPWGTGETGGDLTDEAKSFWQDVGDALVEDGKIILLGCHSAGSPGVAMSFGRKVALASGRRVFGARDFLAAANGGVSLRIVQAIEDGKEPPEMMRLDP